MVRTSDSSDYSKTSSTHPPTGLYPTYSTTTNDDSEESADEYHVEFQPRKLMVPRRFKRLQQQQQQKQQAQPVISEHEHTVVTRCVERTNRTFESDPISYTEAGSYGFRDRTQTDDVTYTSGGHSRRVHLSNVITSLVNFFQNNPRFTKFVLIGLLIYTFICNLEIFVPRIITFLVRLLYPWCRYVTVVIEQCFTALANMFTRLDGLIYATYCEFAVKQCRTRRLMCDVSCSFVDHILSQSRPQLSPPPPQN